MFEIDDIVEDEKKNILRVDELRNCNSKPDEYLLICTVLFTSDLRLLNIGDKVWRYPEKVKKIPYIIP